MSYLPKELLFSQPLTVTKLPNGKWQVERSFEWHRGSIGSGDIIRVPAGYTSDGSSIPQLFWSLIGSPMGETAQSGFLHDFLYSVKGKYADDKPALSRKESDWEFYQAMKALNVPWWKRTIMFLAVRTFGFISYPK